MQEPNRLKWSPDGKYLARLSTDIISIYALPSMQLLDKKSLPALGALDFQWSPKSSHISYYSPATGNQPANVTIVSLPDRTPIASRKLFDITSGRMVWQNDGDYLCVFMTKVTGKKQTNVLLFFRLRESEVPVEQIEIPENIVSISWEPSGDRCAVVLGDRRAGTSINFYSMSGTVITQEEKRVVGAAPSKKGPKPKEIKQLSLTHSIPESKATEVLWSPAGGVCALVFYAPDTCMFDIHDAESQAMLATRRHDRGNRLVWDPSGRIIASCTITDLKHASARGHVTVDISSTHSRATSCATCSARNCFVFLAPPRQPATADGGRGDQELEEVREGIRQGRPHPAPGAQPGDAAAETRLGGEVPRDAGGQQGHQSGAASSACDSEGRV